MSDSSVEYRVCKEYPFTGTYYPGTNIPTWDSLGTWYKDDEKCFETLDEAKKYWGALSNKDEFSIQKVSTIIVTEEILSSKY
jgi:hypothetical protein